MYFLQLLLISLFTFIVSCSNIAQEYVCPDYTFQSEHLCYEAHFERSVSFKRAHEVCQHGNAKLAVISSNKTSKVLSRLAIKNLFENFWVKEDKNSNCTAMKISDAEFHLEKDNCKQNLFAICENKGRQCSRHNWKYGDTCYQVSWFKSKYFIAQKICQNNGATLAVLDTTEKINFIQTALTNDDWWMKISETEIQQIGIKNIGHFWTGAKYDQQTMKWVSYESEPIDYFQKKFNSNNTYAGKCISKANEHYIISNCDSDKYFFCQFPAKPLHELDTHSELIVGTDVNLVNIAGSAHILIGYVIVFFIGCVFSTTISMLYCRQRIKMAAIQDRNKSGENDKNDYNDQSADVENQILEEEDGEIRLYTNNPQDYNKSSV